MLKGIFCSLMLFSSLHGHPFEDQYKLLQKSDSELLDKALGIVQNDLEPNNYEKVLLTRLRNFECPLTLFRSTADRLSDLLVIKCAECLPITKNEVITPVKTCEGYIIQHTVELVSIMSGGDVILSRFVKHFSDSKISKILISRDKESAIPIYKFKNISKTVQKADTVIVLEPMIVTGGSLELALNLLKSKGVKECNIIIASFLASPEGIIHLYKRFPEIRVVVTCIDNGITNDYQITPGFGDFSDRYFGME